MTGVFNTTDAKITSFSPTELCIKCRLRQFSHTNGCVVVFQSLLDDKIVISNIINRIPEEDIAFDCIKSLPDGMYRVYVTDTKLATNSSAFVLSNNFTITRLLPSSVRYHSITSQNGKDSN